MIDLPVKYLPKEKIIVDAKNKSICDVFARMEDSYKQIDERGFEIEKALNHVCEPRYLSEPVEGVADGMRLEPVAKPEEPKEKGLIDKVFKRGPGRPPKDRS